MRIFLVIVFIYSLINSCSSIQVEHQSFEEKIKGMNYTGPGRGPFGEEPFTSMTAIGSNFVALIPEATLYQNTLGIRHTYWGDSTWYGESTEAVLEGITQAKKAGLKIMLKPHLEPGLNVSNWNRPELDRADSTSRANYIQSWREFTSTVEFNVRKRTDWRGDLMSKDEEGWKKIADGYKAYILSYAVLADSMNVDLFCVGTELKAMALEKPDYWRELIKEVREFYDGPITYAANWDSYDEISFWDQLDYVGIDAYFPLGDYKIPSVGGAIADWASYKSEIQSFHSKTGKNIIFTEWGYESEEFAGKTPWGSEGAFNEEVQRNLYEATFQSFWEEPWFQGVFIWRWSPKNEFGRGTYNFSPKGRQAEKVLEKWFDTN
ncbi:MAG: hypothetical protein ABJG47_02545 [Ekhidna sp.]